MTDDDADSSHPSPLAALVDDAIIVSGPTASGKSDLAIRLAQELNGEILSLDSIAVYQGMDIGTAKATAEEQAIVPHHMIDLVPPTEDYSVARYLNEAHRLVDQIKQRGKQPIFVGGTPMYLKGILRGFDPGPPADWEFRETVEADIKQHGIDALYRRLQQVDPLAASKIDPHDARRMIRALEVSKVTGIPMSHRQVQFETKRDASTCRAFVIQWDRSELRRRIAGRVDRMFSSGLVDEVRRLLTQHGQLSRTASQAVGYRELIEAIAEGGQLDHAQQDIVTHTCQMAKRQETWFRSFSELTPIQGAEPFEDSEFQRLVELAS